MPCAPRELNGTWPRLGNHGIFVYYRCFQEKSRLGLGSQKLQKRWVAFNFSDSFRLVKLTIFWWWSWNWPSWMAHRSGRLVLVLATTSLLKEVLTGLWGSWLWPRISKDLPSNGSSQLLVLLVYIIVYDIYSYTWGIVFVNLFVRDYRS